MLRGNYTNIRVKDLNLTVKLRRIRLNDEKKQTLSFSVLLAVLGIIVAFFELHIVENCAFKMDFGVFYYNLSR